MANTAVNSLRGLVMSAEELRQKHPEWDDAFTEDYLSILENLFNLAVLLDVEIDQKIEEIPTNFLDGSIPFADSGLLVEENPGLTWLLSVLNVDGVLNVSGDIKGLNRAKQYYFAGF